MNELELEEKVKELQEFFLQKIIAGEYEIHNADKHRLIIKIYGKYSFSIWIGNVVGSLQFDNHIIPSFIKMDMEISKIDKVAIWERHKEMIEELQDEEKAELKRKKALLENLKKELGEN